MVTLTLQHGKHEKYKIVVMSGSMDEFRSGSSLVVAAIVILPVVGCYALAGIVEHCVA